MSHPDVLPPPDPLRVQVTGEHISAGKPQECMECAWARAVWNALEPTMDTMGVDFFMAWATEEQTTVHIEPVAAQGSSYFQRFAAANPTDVRAFIEAYDRGDTVAPFHAEIGGWEPVP